MNKVIFIIPYFGKLPVYFRAWEMSAKRNETFDFLFITDIKEINAEKNIKVAYTSFEEMRERIRNKFGFESVLDNAYKLCDYKPTYGYLFEEYIEGYEFWGYCDIDIIMGDLSCFITEEKLNAYDKIYEHGHMTLYRNTKENNLCFLNNGDYPEVNIRKVLASPESFYFDEFYGMMLKNRRMNTKTYLNTYDFVDINSKKCAFYDVHNNTNDEIIFEWINGKLFVISVKNYLKKEIVYAHFQKRNINFLGEIDKYSHCGKLYIFYDRLSNKLNYNSPSKKKIKIFETKNKINHIKNFIDRYRKVKNKYSSIFSYYKSRQEFKQQRKDIDLIIKFYNQRLENE